MERNDLCGLLSMINCKSEEERLIYNAMRVSDNVLYPFEVVLKMYKDEAVKNRTFAMEWMNRVLVRESDDTRDLCMRIFDSYLIKSYIDKPEILHDTCFISFAAATSIVLGSKLQHCKSPMKASSLTAFNAKDILFNEKEILASIGPKITPLATPSYFLYYAIPLCSDLLTNEETLIHMTTTMIGEFWEDAASLLYAPSTIAISAIIVCLSILEIDCQSLLSKLPEFFFPSHSTTTAAATASSVGGIFTKQSGKIAYLQFQECILIMETLPCVGSFQKVGSPRSIAMLSSSSSSSSSHLHHHQHHQTK